MSSGHHFVFALIAPLVMAGLCFVALNLAGPWLADRGIYPPIALLLGTVAVWFATRWGIRTFIPVRCVHCQAWACYEMQSHNNHFMCERCGRPS